MWSLYRSSICKCVHSCSKNVNIPLEICANASGGFWEAAGALRGKFGEGSGKVRAGSGPAAGRQRGHFGPAAGEPAPDPPVDISVGLL